jgi:hypothetical protein
MRYTVLWSPDATDDLAKLWMTSSRPAYIASACDLLDKELARSADTLGESREGNRRVVFCAPLLIDFELNEDDRKAYVIAVRELPE